MMILSIMCLYFIYIGLSNLSPRIDEIQKLDIPYLEQLQFMLLNIGIIKNSVTNLNHLSKDNVIFALNLVNSEQTISQILSSMELLACSFKSSHILIFVSSHSNDHTRDIIKQWKSQPPNCTNIHSHIASPSIFGKNDRIFHANGSINVYSITPRKELEEIERMIETKRNGQNEINIGEYRGVFHRNLLLNKALEIYDVNGPNKAGNDYLIFVEANAMINFDVQSIANEFETAWKNEEYDVVCANGIKYNGWYFDSFPTILTDDTWFYGIDKFTNTKVVRSKRFLEVNSCNNGFVAYDLKKIKASKCRYFTMNEAYKQIHSLSNFTNKYQPKRISDHVAFNYCLKERANAKIVIASKAYTHLGVIANHPFVSFNDRLSIHS